VKPLADWLAGRTARERRLLALMGLIAFFTLGWLLIIRPLVDWEVTARARLTEAADRLGDVRGRMSALGVGDGRRVAAARGLGAVDLYVAQSAAEAGFTLDRNDPAGSDRTSVAIATARPQALFGWLGGLEAAGVTVETISARPAETPGSVAVTASLRRIGG